MPAPNTIVFILGLPAVKHALAVAEGTCGRVMLRDELHLGKGRGPWQRAGTWAKVGRGFRRWRRAARPCMVAQRGPVWLRGETGIEVRKRRRALGATRYIVPGGGPERGRQGLAHRG